MVAVGVLLDVFELEGAAANLPPGPRRQSGVGALAVEAVPRDIDRLPWQQVDPQPFSTGQAGSVWIGSLARHGFERVALADLGDRDDLLFGQCVDQRRLADAGWPEEDRRLARRERGTQITRSDMLKNVEEATVVMVNPEHYAVALKWDPNSDSAPICVAKGVDHLAAKIREVAQANGVPIYRDPPTTRSMYRLVEIDEEIKHEHFAAVAAAIQYVDRVRQHIGKRDG